MKKFIANMNISQAVFLILALVLGFQTIYLTLQGKDTNLFDNVLLVIVGYFYGKATWEKETLVEWYLDDKEEKIPAIWYDLDPKEEENAED